MIIWNKIRKNSNFDLLLSLLHLQVPHQLEPELEAALQNLWLLELDQEALSDKGSMIVFTHRDILLND